MNTVIDKIAQAFEASLEEGGPITPPGEIEEFNALDLVSQKILIHKFERYLRYLAKGLGTFTLATTTIEDVQRVSRAISIYSLKFPEMNDGELSEERIRELMHQRQLEHNKQWVEFMVREVPIRRQKQDLDAIQLPDHAKLENMDQGAVMKRAKERSGSDVKFASVFDPPTPLLTGKVPAPEHMYDTAPMTEEQAKRLQDMATQNAAIWIASEEDIEEMVERWHKTMKAAIENGDKGIVIDPCATIAPEGPEGVDEGTVLHRFEVRYYEQGARQIPANRRRTFIWAKDVFIARDQFDALEPDAVHVSTTNTGESRVR